MSIFLIRPRPSGSRFGRGVGSMGDDTTTTPISSGSLSAITGAPVVITAENIVALQKEINRFLTASKPPTQVANIQAAVSGQIGKPVGTPIALSGMLDGDTAYAAIAILIAYATNSKSAPAQQLVVNQDVVPLIQTLTSLTNQAAIAWVQTRITTTYNGIRAYGDELGLPAANPIPWIYVAGAVVAAAFFLIPRKRGRKK